MATKKQTPKKDIKKVEEETSKLTPSNFNFKSKNVQIILLIVIGFLALFYFAKSKLTIATVNGQPISRLELISLLEKQSGKQALESLITKTLINQEASKQNIFVTQEELDAEIAAIESQFAGQPQSLDDVLTMQGITRDDLIDQLKTQLLVDKMTVDESSISAEDIDTYIDTNKENLPDESDTPEFREQVRKYLESNKSSEKAKDWLTSLKAQAQINYIKEY